MSVPSELERIGAFISGMEDRAAQRTERVREGVALLDDRIPHVYFANQLRLNPGANLTASDVASEAERVLGGASFGHRRVTVHNDVVGHGLAPGLRALGWEVERVAVMVQEDPPEHRIETRSVREVTDGGWKPFRRRMLEHERMDPEVVQEMEDAVQNLIRTVGLRSFGAAVDGVVAACCDLFSDGATAQIEAVATLEEYRNRGLARAVVWKAVQDARSRGHDLIFLCANADDWPRTLYRRLGFREIGYFFEFLKILPMPVPSG